MIHANSRSDNTPNSGHSDRVTDQSKVLEWSIHFDWTVRDIIDTPEEAFVTPSSIIN